MLHSSALSDIAYEPGVRAQVRRGSMREDGPEALAMEAARDTELEETRRRVRQALMSLDERTRMLLVLRHAGYSYRGLAQALGVKESSIGALLALSSATFQAAFDKAENQKGPP